MKCEHCGTEFDHVRDTATTDYKLAICYNPECEKYCQPQWIKVQEEKSQ
jgi:hypothetical protein